MCKGEELDSSQNHDDVLASRHNLFQFYQTPLSCHPRLAGVQSIEEARTQRRDTLPCVRPCTSLSGRATSPLSSTRTIPHRPSAELEQAGNSVSFPAQKRPRLQTNG